MKIFKSLVFTGVCLGLMAAGGCNSQLKDLKIQNDIQQKRIAQLESELQVLKLEHQKAKRELETAESVKGVEVIALQQKIAALEEDIQKKKALIASMQQQLLFGASLPVELSTMLEDFAKTESNMVEYDADRGIVKFKSDLLFEPGSDVVAANAVEAVKSLCRILNSEQGKKFDIIIAGHTDDMRIGRPATREKHPTNWHLSAHRAISVLDIMTQGNLEPERMSIRGFGEFRPVVPNKPNKKGNPQNRRVEIYIVPKGM